MSTIFASQAVNVYALSLTDGEVEQRQAQVEFILYSTIDDPTRHVLKTGWNDCLGVFKKSEVIHRDEITIDHVFYGPGQKLFIEVSEEYGFVVYCDEEWVHSVQAAYEYWWQAHHLAPHEYAPLGF